MISWLNMNASFLPTWFITKWFRHLDHRSGFLALYIHFQFAKGFAPAKGLKSTDKQHWTRMSPIAAERIGRTQCGPGRRGGAWRGLMVGLIQCIETNQLTTNTDKLFNLHNESLSIGGQVWEPADMFSAAVPARQTTVLHLDLGELLHARYTHQQQSVITRPQSLSDWQLYSF